MRSTHRPTDGDRGLVHHAHVGEDAPRSCAQVRTGDEPLGDLGERESGAVGGSARAVYRVAGRAGTQRVLYAEKMDVGLIQPLIDASARYGTLKATFPAMEFIAPEAL